MNPFDGKREDVRAADGMAVTALAKTRDHLVCGGLDGSLFFIESGSGKTTVEKQHANSIQVLATSPDGDWLVSSSREKLLIWDRTLRPGVLL